MASTSTPPRPRLGACVFTIVREEPVFLPIWLRYYARHFAAEDIYVLHHTVSTGPADTCTAGLDCKVIEVRNDEFDPVWLREVVCEHQAALLRRYQAVLFAEVDEIVLPDPRQRPGGLRSFIADFLRTDAPAVSTTGWELHHDFGSEPAADLGRPLLEQRGLWHRNVLYDKALLTTVPLAYSLGFHTSEPAFAPEEGLLLLHLHKYDLASYLARHEARAAMRHSSDAVRNGWNAHYRATGAQLMAQYLRTAAPLEPVPAWLRETGVV